MTTTVEIEHPGYEAICPWHHRQPFDRVRAVPDGDQPGRRPLFVVGARPGQQHAVVDLRRHEAGELRRVLRAARKSGSIRAITQARSRTTCLRGCLHLGNPDTADVIEIQAGDAANIPAFAYHHCLQLRRYRGPEILWWVPGEMHTDEWKEKVHEGRGKWYEREPVTLNGPHERNEGFPSHLDDLASWPQDRSRRRARWTCSTCRARPGCIPFEGTDRRKMIQRLVLLLRRAHSLREGLAAALRRVAAQLGGLRAAAVCGVGHAVGQSGGWVEG